MSERLCGFCGVDISHRHHNANYCNRVCRDQRYYQANREQRVARDAAYYQANRAEKLQGFRSYYLANRETRLEYQRTWGASNRDKVSLLSARKRAIKVKATSRRFSDEEWRKLITRYRGCCAYCGYRPNVLHMEHVIPLSRGGSHTIGNVLPACSWCNLRKGASYLMEWKLRLRRGGESYQPFMQIRRSQDRSRGRTDENVGMGGTRVATRVPAST